MPAVAQGGDAARFEGQRGYFWGLFGLGVAFLFFALWWAQSPSQVEATTIMGIVGFAVLQCLPWFVRRVRLEPAYVVIDYLLWRRAVPYSQIKDVSVHVFGAGGAQQQVLLQLGAGKKRRLGMLVGDAYEVARVVRSAVERGRAHTAAAPAPLSTDRKLAYAAAVTLISLAVLGPLGALGYYFLRMDEGQMIEREVVLESVSALRGKHGLSVKLHMEDGRVLRSATAAEIRYAALARSLERDPAKPFRAIADRATWSAPWVPLSGDRLVSIYAISRGGESFLTVEESAAQRARSRNIMWGIFMLPMFLLGLTVFNILR
jgi:hypothetical protein